MSTSKATASGTPARTLRSPAQLAAQGWVDEAALPALEAVAARFAVAVTPAMLDQIEAASDPVGLQFIPDARELRLAPEERSDPVGDDAFSPLPGLVHRYPDRVLLKPLHACPVYCRFCFRREVVGPGGAALDAGALARAIDWVRARPEIWEVIVTGGDPFALSADRIAALMDALDAIPHVQVVRWHTRVPVVEPRRVTPALVAALRRPTPAWVVLHCNSDLELSPAAREAIGALVDAGVPMLSQSVLLRGVNDAPEQLEALLRALVRLRVKPYYLHHGDLVPGTAHLRAELEAGRALVDGLRGRVSGLCQPSYVLDIPGGYGKVPAGPAWVQPAAEGWAVRDPWGGAHRYPPEPKAEG
jgi:lysine 2,3-aminomutase